MRLRKCKSCGIEFQGSGEQHLCPACRKAARAASVVRPRVCVTCGRTFDGGPRASYCSECRAERARKADAESKRRKAAGLTRKLGSTDICAACGGEYVVMSGLQRYCPACAPEAVRQKVLPAKRRRAAEHMAENAARKKELRAGSAVCVYCGRTFTPVDASVTCSEECAREHRRIVLGTADYKRGRRKAPPPRERYDSGLPRSDVPGVAYLRQRRKWQVTHKGKYVGVFDTREEAEAKKRELMSPGLPDS